MTDIEQYTFAPANGAQIRKGVARYSSGSASREILSKWNKWVRQIHRWMTVGITVGILVNMLAVAQKKYTVWTGLLALLPLALLLLTGLYLFMLPYVAKWRSARRTARLKVYF